VILEMEEVMVEGAGTGTLPPYMATSLHSTARARYLCLHVQDFDANLRNLTGVAENKELLMVP